MSAIRRFTKDLSVNEISWQEPSLQGHPQRRKVRKYLRGEFFGIVEADPGREFRIGILPATGEPARTI
jgi:hypothetical protein